MRQQMQVPSRATRNADFAKSNIEAVVVRVVVELLEEEKESPTLVAVAARIGINVRTLQRRLEATSVRFRELLAECRQARAERELRNNKRSLSEISTHLGYSDPSHFARAFRRWTGYSPSEYRRRNRKRAGFNGQSS
jgi:AraC-like DNA-binding protein